MHVPIEYSFVHEDLGSEKKFLKSDISDDTCGSDKMTLNWRNLQGDHIHFYSLPSFIMCVKSTPHM